MDAKTRYLLACEVTKERYVEDARKHLKKSNEVANRRPYAIVPDGLKAHQRAVKEEFYDITASIQNPYIRLHDFETKPNNNDLERLNSYVSAREQK